jgi:phage-related protein
MAMDIFGKSGADLLPMIMQGTDALNAQREKVRELGLSYSGENAAAAGAYKDAMEDLTSSFRGLMIAIGPTIAAIVTQWTPGITKAVTGVKDWMGANPGLSQSIVTCAAAIGGILTVLGPLLMMVPGIAAAFSMVGSVVAGVVPVLTAVGGAIAALFAGLSAPILAVAALIGVAVHMIVTNWQGMLEGLDVIWDGLVVAGEAVAGFFSSIWDTITGVFEAGWNWIAGIIAQIADAIGGLFSAIGSLVGLGGVPALNIPGRAVGGPVTGGMPYIVGEQGPELFVPSQSGRIIPNGAGGGANVTINMNGATVRSEADIRALSEALAETVGRELRGMGAFA